MSRPDKVFFPLANWKVPKTYAVEQDVGPAVEHIYEVINYAVSNVHSSGWGTLSPLFNQEKIKKNKQNFVAQ